MEHFLAVRVTLNNQRNFINSGSGGQYHLTLRSASVPEEELMAIGARLRAAGCWSLSRTQFVANLSAMAPLERDLEQASPSTPVGSIFNLRPSSNEKSEEHTSELQSLMRISYAVFCLKKK